MHENVYPINANARLSLAMRKLIHESEIQMKNAQRYRKSTQLLKKEIGALGESLRKYSDELQKVSGKVKKLNRRSRKLHGIMERHLAEHS